MSTAVSSTQPPDARQPFIADTLTFMPANMAAVRWARISARAMRCRSSAVFMPMTKVLEPISTWIVGLLLTSASGPVSGRKPDQVRLAIFP